MRSKRTIRAAAALAATAMLTSALAVPVASAAGAEEAQPAATIVDNAKSRPAFSPTAITMHRSSPNGCNLVMTNTTATDRWRGHALAHSERAALPRPSRRLEGGDYRSDEPDAERSAV